MRNRLTPSPATYLLLGLALLLSACACNGFFENVADKVENIIVRRTPREAFAHDYFQELPAGDSLVAAWDSAFVRTLQDTLVVDLPHRELVRRVDDLEFTALSYRFYLPPGRLLTISTEAASGVGPVFGELFAVDGDNSIDPDDALLRWEPGAAGGIYETAARSGQELLLVVQSAPSDTGAYALELRTDPALLFPVAGHSARHIQSFWGDSRSGGARQHQGNDIFAPRGTPLVAVSDGIVRSTKVGGLGGKTVWLRDGEGRGLTYYYAHLDSQLVRPGQIVTRGDTLGLVGNTGNARTTPPHLHFGIYRNGARDPYSYLLGPDGVPADLRYSLAPTELPDSVPERGRHYLRRSPASQRTVVVRELANEEPVTVLSATDRFYRIRTERGETGYANFD
ncbi:peptidase M23-like protein [Neolewinella xylanilytica]|uniref:Peptidase M23-like protein n=1 Tax=Neolewinella xylanilytica TaxID=1514080 RepID=A0A2S6I0Q8_9BACT|nr:M23 family metallopeptidase [Neolewinella xylanilytica]PPK84526.1 peptidase M23-like protein [Neolewinella xylanilytica]